MTDIVPTQRFHNLARFFTETVPTAGEAGGESSELFTAEIMDRILGADGETPEEIEAAIFAAQDAGTVASKEFLYRPFTLTEDGATLIASTEKYANQGGLPVYYLLRVHALDTGEEVVINAGGRTVVAVITALKEKGVLARYPDGMPLQFIAKSTASDNDVVLLVPWKAPASGKGKK